MSNVDSLNRMFLFLANIFRANGQVNGRSLYRRIYAALLAIVLCLSGSLSGLIALPAVALAEGASLPTAEAIAPPTSSTNIAADKVDQFAIAYLQVLKLLSNREPELPAAETSAEALKVQQSIEAEAIELIGGSGLAMADYMKMLSLASQDETFRGKVLSRMDEALQE